MSRKLTTYRHPSIADRLANARSIDEIAMLREVLQDLFRDGKLDPAGKTVRTWHETMWARVTQLILAAATDEDACYVYNVALAWPKPAGLQEALATFLAAKVARMPNHVERLSRAGIIVEGVSTPAQRERAEKIQCGWMPVMFRPEGAASYELFGLADPKQFAEGGLVPRETRRLSEAPLRLDLTLEHELELAGSPANTEGQS